MSLNTQWVRCTICVGLRMNDIHGGLWCASESNKLSRSYCKPITQDRMTTEVGQSLCKETSVPTMLEYDLLSNIVLDLRLGCVHIFSVWYWKLCLQTSVTLELSCSKYFLYELITSQNPFLLLFNFLLLSYVWMYVETQIFELCNRWSLSHSMTANWLMKQPGSALVLTET